MQLRPLNPEAERDHHMRRRYFLTGLGVVATGLATVQQTFAAAKTYKYRCPKCKLIQEYGTMGTKKCPNDGTTMIRQQ
jgi:hypothetical protein